MKQHEVNDSPKKCTSAPISREDMVFPSQAVYLSAGGVATEVPDLRSTGFVSKSISDGGIFGQGGRKDLFLREVQHDLGKFGLEPLTSLRAETMAVDRPSLDSRQLAVEEAVKLLDANWTIIVRDSTEDKVQKELEELMTKRLCDFKPFAKDDAMGCGYYTFGRYLDATGDIYQVEFRLYLVEFAGNVHTEVKRMCGDRNLQFKFFNLCQRKFGADGVEKPAEGLSVLGWSPAAFEMDLGQLEFDDSEAMDVDEPMMFGDVPMLDLELADQNDDEDLEAKKSSEKQARIEYLIQEITSKTTPQDIFLDCIRSLVRIAREEPSAVLETSPGGIIEALLKSTDSMWNASATYGILAIVEALLQELGGKAGGDLKHDFVFKMLNDLQSAWTGPSTPLFVPDCAQLPCKQIVDLCQSCEALIIR